MTAELLTCPAQWIALDPGGCHWESVDTPCRMCSYVGPFGGTETPVEYVERMRLTPTEHAREPGPMNRLRQRVERYRRCGDWGSA